MIPDSTNPRVLADNIRVLEKKIESGGGSGLPDVDISDVGKVLTVGDTGEWEADDLPPQLPEIEASDFGSYLSVDENGEWGLNIPEGGVYTTVTGSSVETGNTIFGEKEYVYVAASTPANGSFTNVGHRIHGIISVTAMHIISDGGSDRYAAIDLTEKIVARSASSDSICWISNGYVEGTNFVLKFY